MPPPLCAAGHSIAVAVVLLLYLYPVAAAVAGCAAGQYWDTSASVCINCPAGKYNPSKNQVGASSCLNCAAGFYTATPASKRCSGCTKGTYSLTAASACTNCDAGRFAGGNSNSACANCTAGKFSTAAASMCTNCPAGSYSGAGAASCVACSPGRFTGVTQSTSCANCIPGTYSNLPGATACTSCSAGTYGTASGATVCLNCPAGSTSASGATGCATCQAGTFASTAGTGGCSSCPAGRYSQANASSCPLDYTFRGSLLAETVSATGCAAGRSRMTASYLMTYTSATPLYNWVGPLNKTHVRFSANCYNLTVASVGLPTCSDRVCSRAVSVSTDCLPERSDGATFTRCAIGHPASQNGLVPFILVPWNCPVSSSPPTGCGPDVSGKTNALSATLLVSAGSTVAVRIEQEVLLLLLRSPTSALADSSILSSSLVSSGSFEVVRTSSDVASLAVAMGPQGSRSTHRLRIVPSTINVTITGTGRVLGWHELLDAMAAFPRSAVAADSGLPALGNACSGIEGCDCLAFDLVKLAAKTGGASDFTVAFGFVYRPVTVAASQFTVQGDPLVSDRSVAVQRRRVRLLFTNRHYLPGGVSDVVFVCIMVPLVVALCAMGMLLFVSAWVRVNGCNESGPEAESVLPVRVMRAEFVEVPPVVVWFASGE